MDAIAVLVAVALVFGPWILAGVALSKAKTGVRNASRLEHSFRVLTAEVERLKGEVNRLRSDLAPAQEPKPKAAAAPPREPPMPVEAQRRPEVPSSIPSVPLKEAAGAPTRAASIEEALTSRWLVWVGAVAIALGGTFFVKYAIDQGWLGPAIRVSLGFLFGIALALGGEWLRRRPLQRAIAALRPDYVPPALTSAGVFTAFASIYAAHALHDLLGPLVAFFALAIVALTAIGLSILQGWFVALLGLVGAFLTPALVTTPEPSAWALFGYLLVIQVACLAVVRYQGWWWLAFAALSGAAFWPLLWIAAIWKPADTLPLGVYLLMMAGAFLFIRYGMQRTTEPQEWFVDMSTMPLPERIGWVAAIVVGILFFLMAERAEFSATALAFVALLAILYLFVGRRESIFDGLFPAAGILVLALMVSWELPSVVTRPRPLFKFGEVEYGKALDTPLVPPELSDFTTALLVFGALFGIGGFVALWGARRPAIWAGVSAALPLLLLAIGYWRIVDFQLDFAWALIALVLAAISLAAATQVEHHRKASGLSTSLGFYAAAVIAFVSLGITMTLQQAWLTVALSFQLPALAWIGRRVSIQPIQVIAGIVAAIILVRLILNFNVLDYPVSASPIFSWVIYGYGIPAIMFFLSARLFKQKKAASILVMLLEAGGLAFATLLVSLEIRLFIEGSINSANYDLLEQSLQSIAWLSIGYVLAVHFHQRGHIVSFYGARILTGLAVAQVVILQLWWFNPIITHDPVGDYPLVNVLFLAYVIPAVFAFGFAIELSGSAQKRPSRLFADPRGVAAAGLLGVILLFVYFSLEVCRAFRGPVLSLVHASDAELYAYSAVWLVYALTLLALGIYLGQIALRYASLIVLIVTAIKVFVVDMADLTGLYRVVSFLALGFVLVGIGLIYQRYVFRRPAAKPPGDRVSASL